MASYLADVFVIPLKIKTLEISSVTHSLQMPEIERDCVCVFMFSCLTEAVGGVEYGWLSNWASLDKTFIFRENTKAQHKASMTTRRETMSARRPGHQ